MIQRGAAMLNRRSKQVRGVEAVYTRGGNSIPLTVVPGRTRFASNEQGGARVEWNDADFGIVMADLKFGGVMVEPRLGDRITRIVDGPPTNQAYWDDGEPIDWDDGAPVLWEEPVYTRTYEIRTPHTGEKAWRESDNDPTSWRVHTERVY